MSRVYSRDSLGETGSDHSTERVEQVRKKHSEVTIKFIKLIMRLTSIKGALTNNNSPSKRMNFSLSKEGIA